MSKTCPHCKSSELDVDPSRGDIVCTNCGSVLEENTIVSEVTIQENADGSSSVVGQFVSSEGSYKPYLSGFQYGLGKESRQVTLDKGKQSIRDLAALLKLNKHCIDTAYNFFKMAISKRLSRGRRISHIVAACLYMTCRTEGTPHLLLDFSDITQVNVFTLGKVFLLLAKELHINLPVLGYLGKKYEGSSYPAASTYWNPSPTEHWQCQLASSVQSESGKRPSIPQNTDEFNMKASSRANTFSATTKVREVPVSGIYKKEIQEFRSRTPSARGVRAAAITNRSWVASHSARASSIGPTTVRTRGGTSTSEQSARLQREYDHLQLTRERKRQAQMSSHRMDRMYYMHGSSTKLHDKYEVTDEELGRLRSLAISQGIKIPFSAFSDKRSSIISGPHSTPRGPNDYDDLNYDPEQQNGQKTVIPTADDLSTGGDVVSQDGTEKASSANTKEDRATSDNEDDDLTRFDVLTPTDRSADRTPPTETPKPSGDTISVKSDTAVLSQKQRNVTFLTEAQDENYPCMYITRFAHRLDFGEKTNDVTVTALRLVSRMKRDWLHTGRRPSGLCGAALLVAARLHGFNCDLNDIVKVVKIGHETIRKRLTEFESTPSSQLTINEFMNIDLEAEHDPPAFYNGRIKTKIQQLETQAGGMSYLETEIGKLSHAIDDKLAQGRPDSPVPSESPNTPIKHGATDAGLHDEPAELDPALKVSASFVHSENPQVLAETFLPSNRSLKQQHGPACVKITGPAPTVASLGLNQSVKESLSTPSKDARKRKKSDDGELDLDGIDDEEINRLLLTPRESEIKSKIWIQEFGGFVKEMEEKRQKKQEEQKKKARPFRNVRTKRKEYYGESRTAGEALEKLLSRQKLSNKIDYEALRKATEDDKTEAAHAPHIVIESQDSKPIHAKKKPKVAEACFNFGTSDTTAPSTENIEETKSVVMTTEDEEEEEEDVEYDDGSCVSASQLLQSAGMAGYGNDTDIYDSMRC